MIPAFITKAHIVKAMRRISREGVLPRRKGRGYCLVKDGNHFPPKYTIALAHQLATGKGLRSDKFSGGPESNKFLKTRGFNIVHCNCGGSYRARSITPPSEQAKKRTHFTQPARHSERCRECKKRVREMLERIYGKCLQNHRFSWPAQLSSYKGTSVYSALRNVVTVLEKCRGFGFKDFVRAETLAPCDFWVPDPGFIVEFDESQHFTSPRKQALSAYPHDQPLGFSSERWGELCEQHNAKDDDPPYRDEQRAWYDTLRDLSPSLKGFGPTVRLYARDFAWCSLDADSSDDQRRFSAIAFQDTTPASQMIVETSISDAPTRSILRAAMVFPEVNKGTALGVPPEGEGAQEPDVPTLVSFQGETIDFALFPEAYIRSSDAKRIKSLKKLARDLNAPLLVGAIERGIDSNGRASQVLLHFEPDGSYRRIYTKHSTADAVAFENPDWTPNVMLPTFELGSVRAGATICHDHYLGLLPRFLAKCGAHLWVNPSYNNVTDIKWSSILRLRAVENRFFALCTLHDDKRRGKSTHPFAFSPDGKELQGRQAGCEVARPLSKCNESGTVYVVDLDMKAIDELLDWSRLPPAKKPKSNRKGKPRKPIRVALRRGGPAILGRSGWQTVESGCRVETNRGSVYVGVVSKEQILDAAACFRVLDRANQMECAPIIWNHWGRLPTDSARLATLMMGRAIECCAPVIISDGEGIHELIELANRNKIPARRTIETSGETIVDIGNAWGLDNAFKMVTQHVSRGMEDRALDRYRRLA
ncbi:MAG: carbon-nitrogen hydrolase family protein [Nitrospira sp.]|nr:carbon-nitrogen hydrolase family protein [Nitrospira sp.]